MTILDTANYRNCPVGAYHHYKVLHTDSRLQREMCKYCKVVKEFAFTENGQMKDERKYFLEHIRAFAQPSMACYYEINPDAAAQMLLKDKQEKNKIERSEEMTEKFHFAIGRALKDKDDGIKKHSPAKPKKPNGL